MGEWNYIIAMPVASLLFMIGGTGFKWARRYVLPLLLGGMVLLNGQAWWQSVALAFGLGIAFSLPYGDSVDWPLRLLVLGTYPLITCVLGVTYWQPIYFLLISVLFILSRLRLTEKLIPWKLWEGVAGGGIGLIVAYLLCK